MSNARLRTTARRLALATTAALAGALLAFASTASAARDPIASGDADFHLKNGMLRKLDNLGVAVQGVGAGTVTGKKIGLELRDGMFDPTDSQGFVDARGGFKLLSGSRGAAVWNITVNTVKGAVYAKVAGARMQLGTLLLPTAGREGFGARVKFGKLALTPKAAKRISNRLGLQGSKRIDGGRVLSNTFVLTVPQTVTLLPEGAAKLTVSGTALGKFAAKGVKGPQAFTALPPATEPTPTSLQVPVIGGALAPDASAGNVLTAGGLQIVKEAKPFSPTVRMANLTLDFGAKTASVDLELLPTPPFPGPAGSPAIATLVVKGPGVTANPTTREIAVVGEARLQANAATTLNNMFNQPPPQPPPSSNFVVGDPLGNFSLSVQAQ